MRYAENPTNFEVVGTFILSNLKICALPIYTCTRISTDIIATMVTLTNLVLVDSGKKFSSHVLGCGLLDPLVCGSSLLVSCFVSSFASGAVLLVCQTSPMLGM